MLELRRLSPSALPTAIEKALRYRLLNEPGEAESICRDVLEVEPSRASLAPCVIKKGKEIRWRLSRLDESRGKCLGAFTVSDADGASFHVDRRELFEGSDGRNDKRARERR